MIDRFRCTGQGECPRTGTRGRPDSRKDRGSPAGRGQGLAPAARSGRTRPSRRGRARSAPQARRGPVRRGPCLGHGSPIVSCCMAPPGTTGQGLPPSLWVCLLEDRKPRYNARNVMEATVTSAVDRRQREPLFGRPWAEFIPIWTRIMTHADRGERSDRPDLGATDPGPVLGSDHE